ncbi:MAG: hypothetical protein U0930_15100 [Pirellulales bacterium]
MSDAANHLPRIRNTPLKITKRGYLRQLGCTSATSKSTAKFALGYDSAVAAKRRKDIEAIYYENSRYLHGAPYWNPFFLGLARQIEQTSFAVVETESLSKSLGFLGQNAAEKILKFRSIVKRLQMQGVLIQFDDEDLQVHTAPNKLLIKSSTTFHQALASYSQDRLANYVGEFTGRKSVEDKINRITECTNDCLLSEFGFRESKAVIDYWRNRPATKSGNHCSQSFAEGHITEFRKLCHWIGANYEEFTCPDFQAIDSRIKKLSTDKSSNAPRDMFFRPQELQEIFRTAQPMAKLIIALGLNCCAGAAELGRFKVSDFHFETVHPYHEVVDFHQKQSWLISSRKKTQAHSESLLWDWVVPLVKEQVQLCKRKGWIYLFTENGEPLYRDNAIYRELGLPEPNTTKPESRFTKRFNNAVEKAFKDSRITRQLSLGKLRKTFSNFLTMKAHADLGTLALSHVSDADEQLKHYANKPYARLFQVTLEYQDYWRLSSKAKT